MDGNRSNYSFYSLSDSEYDSSDSEYDQDSDEQDSDDIDDGKDWSKVASYADVVSGAELPEVGEDELRDFIWTHIPIQSRADRSRWDAVIRVKENLAPEDYFLQNAGRRKEYEQQFPTPREARDEELRIRAEQLEIFFEKMRQKAEDIKRQQEERKNEQVQLSKATIEGGVHFPLSSSGDNEVFLRSGEKIEPMNFEEHHHPHDEDLTEVASRASSSRFSVDSNQLLRDLDDLLSPTTVTRPTSSRSPLKTVPEKGVLDSF